MKCEEIQNKIEQQPEKEISIEMQKHLSQCEECTQYYATIQTLIPNVLPKAPTSIKQNVINQIRRKQEKRPVTINPLFRIVASVAAFLAIVLLITIMSWPNQAKAAQNILENALHSAAQIKTMVMKFVVRTESNENFSYINLNDGMVEHTLIVDMNDGFKWRLTKGGRTIVYDGSSKYMWSAGENYGFKGGKNANFEEGFNILLDPTRILMLEKASADKKGNKYHIKETDAEIEMTVEAKAEGDFTNTYLRNSSILESDTRRVYVFDKQTNLIKSLRIYVKDGNNEILVVDIKNIEYDVNVDNQKLTQLPSGYEWRDSNNKITDHRFLGTSPEDVAHILFKAMENKDISSVKDILSYYDMKTLEVTYNGAKLINLGNPFKSGLYPGVFVPYEIMLPDGSIRKQNLALRNDNEDKVWIIDGGL